MTNPKKATAMGGKKGLQGGISKPPAAHGSNGVKKQKAPAASTLKPADYKKHKKGKKGSNEEENDSVSTVSCWFCANFSSGFVIEDHCLLPKSWPGAGGGSPFPKAWINILHV